MKIGVFLDDVRVIDQLPTRIDEWITVKNYDGFVYTIGSYYEAFNCLPEIISFDHSLSTIDEDNEILRPVGAPLFYANYKEKTGKDCAEWLVQFAKEEDLDIGRVAIHSTYLLGAKRIEDIINDYKRERGNYVSSPCFRVNWQYK